MDSTTELDTDIDEQESFHLHIEETPDADGHRLSPIESESGSESILSAPRSKKKVRMHCIITQPYDRSSVYFVAVYLDFSLYI